MRSLQTDHPGQGVHDTGLPGTLAEHSLARGLGLAAGSTLLAGREEGNSRIWDLGQEHRSHELG